MSAAGCVRQLDSDQDAPEILGKSCPADNNVLGIKDEIVSLETETLGQAVEKSFSR